MFSCAAARGGIDALAGYGMDIGPDTRKVTNPARTAARKRVAAAHDELATAERALPQLLNGQGTPKQKNAALPGVHKRTDTALAAADRWCCDYSRSTPKHGWPSTSTPTSPTPTSTGRSCATCSTSAATSPTPPTRSPSPSTDQSAPESPAPSSSSPKNSTPPQRSCPPTPGH